MDNSGMSWVFGGLLAILAIALIIAGATGHAAQLFQGVVGKPGKTPSTDTSTAASESASANVDAILQALGSASSPSTNSPNGSSPSSSSAGATTPGPTGQPNIYSGLGNLQGITA